MSASYIYILNLLENFENKILKGEKQISTTTKQRFDNYNKRFACGI